MSVLESRVSESYQLASNHAITTGGVTSAFYTISAPVDNAYASLFVKTNSGMGLQLSYELSRDGANWAQSSGGPVSVIASHTGTSEVYYPITLNVAAKRIRFLVESLHTVVSSDNVNIYFVQRQ